MSATDKSPSRGRPAAPALPGDIVLMSDDTILPPVGDASPWALRVLASAGRDVFRMRRFVRTRARAGQELCAGLVQAADRLGRAESALSVAGWWWDGVRGDWRPAPRLPGFDVGDPVSKVGGDYIFEGEVRAVLMKRSGNVRYVVEDDRGILHIFNEKQLTPGLSKRSA